MTWKASLAWAVSMAEDGEVVDDQELGSDVAAQGALEDAVQLGAVQLVSMRGADRPSNDAPGIEAGLVGEGTGKTFLARALAYRACQATRRVVFVSAPRMLNELHGAELHGSLDRALRRYVRADLLVIDDFAVLAMDTAQAKLAFQVISERYDYRRSTCITTNRPFKDWTKVFPDALNAQVIAERLTERAEHFVLEKGFRTARP